MKNREYLAARIALGIVNAYDIQDDVNDLINNGIFYNEFIDIIDSQPPTLIDVLDPYKKFLNRLNVSIPTHEKAILTIVDFQTERIVNNDVDPLQGLEKLSSVFEYINLVADKNYRKELGLQPLMDIYELDYLPYPPFGKFGLLTIETRIVREAKNWREKYLHE